MSPVFSAGAIEPEAMAALLHPMRRGKVATSVRHTTEPITSEAMNAAAARPGRRTRSTIDRRRCLVTDRLGVTGRHLLLHLPRCTFSSAMRLCATDFPGEREPGHRLALLGVGCGGVEHET